MESVLKKLNTMTNAQFIECFGGIFEHSPWIAEKATHKRPFHSIEEVFSTMKKEVEQSPEKDQLALILEHPELGKRIEMSDASIKEQSGAGLNSLTPEEYETFSNLNRMYMEKFEFPFIIAVAGKDKNDILKAMKQRLTSTKEIEFQTALQQIYQIAELRFNAIIQSFN